MAVDAWVDAVALFWGSGVSGSPGWVDVVGGRRRVVELRAGHGGYEGLGAAGLTVVDSV